MHLISVCTRFYSVQSSKGTFISLTAQYVTVTEECKMLCMWGTFGEIKP